jgi:eukaryotic-like serine/threonine-protein kinase
MDQARVLIERIARAYAESETTGPATSQDFSQRCLGAYRLVERVSRGGMGDVYRAERNDNMHDAPVAIKLLRAHLDADTLERRFDRERRILARLNHPNIAHLIDGGSTEHGLPYLVMEWVDGQVLTQYASQHSLSLEARLELFLTVCDAVATAHRNLIVHRDLKPGNILVTSEGQVKLLDFGISKLLLEGDEGELPLTRTDLLPMTPAYAAPEQILGDPVTTATDVYALGIVLYELLTGERPHRRDNHALTALAASVDTESITRPSELVRNKAATVVQKRWSRQLCGDLDNIILNALKREPNRRYASAEALAEDLRRYLAGQPIKARPDSVRYRTGKFIGRHRLGLTATTLVILALLVGLGTALWQAKLARDQADNALRTKEFVVSLLADASPSRSAQGAELKAVELLQQSVRRVDAELAHTPELQAELRMVMAQALLSMGDLDTATGVGERGVAQLRQLYGSHSIELADGLYALARIRVRTGPIEEAQALIQECLNILDRLLDAPDLMRARAQGLLASVKNQQGQHLEAMALYSQALEGRMALIGENNPGLAVAYSNLATTALQAERYREAEANYRQAHRLLLQAGGPEHPRMANIHNGLGLALLGLGDFLQAEVETTRALDIGTRKMGPGSETVIASLLNLAEIKRRLGSYEETSAQYLESARLAEQSGFIMLQGLSLLRLGQVELARHRYQEALQALQLAEQIKSERFPDRAQTALIKVALGLAMAHHGDLIGGREKAEQGLSELAARQQDQGLIYAEAAELYAEIQALAGEFDQSRHWLEKASELTTAVLGPAHLQSRRLADELAQIAASAAE